MKVRNQVLRNEPVHTRFGIIKLDHGGYPTNLHELEGVTPEDLLKLPDFVDGEVYPHSPNAYPPEVKIVAPAQGESKPGAKGEADPNREKVKGLIQELLTAEASGTKLPRNGEGYLAMDFLDSLLKERGLPRITGTIRKELEDELRAEANPGESQPKA
jgi:hypothetical protein